MTRKQRNFISGQLNSLRVCRNFWKRICIPLKTKPYTETDVDLQNIPWTPIGNKFPDQSGNSYNRLSGAVFNGNSHVIRNLFIDASKLENTGDANCGLFGFAENINILNLCIEDGVLLNEVGGFEDGLLAGKLNNCNVSDCNVTGKITETGSINCIGGMIGQVYSGSNSESVTVERCYSKCRN